MSFSGPQSTALALQLPKKKKKKVHYNDVFLTLGLALWGEDWFVQPQGNSLHKARATTMIFSVHLNSRVKGDSANETST